MRVGKGYDVHRFQAGSFVMLGGVKISFDKGLAAHSDGDVLIHAICDALLGAAAMGDIGQHFPDTDDNLQGIDSRKLLRHVHQLLQDKGYRIVNLDATLIAEKPKISPHISQIRETLAADLQIGIDQINIKGTTTEKLGFTGREEGIAAEAVCLIE